MMYRWTEFSNVPFIKLYLVYLSVFAWFLGQFILFLRICIIVRDPIIKQGVFGIPLTGLIPPHVQYLSHAGTSTLDMLC
jgi:hypothetical protein